MIETEFLALLNSSPTHNGVKTETLSDARMIELRDELHAVIRGEAPAEQLNGHLAGMSRRPIVTANGVRWQLDGDPVQLPYAAVVLEWARISEQLPGRLRACADPECNKFLIDHSKPNTARWCSMAVCGNRAKARKHYAKTASASE